jgi:Protein of unknown function DUF262
MSTSERTVADLITEIDEDRLEIKPFFQRRLVWTGRDKEYFIDTVLRQLPFPEIFIATHKIDTEKVRVNTWLVDGQQRISTLKDYIRGESDLLYRLVKPFAQLDQADQQKILHYKISVRDLGLITVPQIREIFNRINSTDYSLKKMEILNALYSGEYKRYCVELSEHEFFLRHRVFRKGGDKRMSDVTFCVILVTTILAGYYRRDERNEEYLRRYNDEFPDKVRVQSELDKLFDFLDRCGLPEKSRAWKHTDLFTLLVELHSAIIIRNLSLDPAVVGPRCTAFYEYVDEAFKDPKAVAPASLPVAKEDIQKYLKAGTKATNDKYARLDRAEVILKVLTAAFNPGHAAPPSVGTKPFKKARKGKDH